MTRKKEAEPAEAPELVSRLAFDVEKVLDIAVRLFAEYGYDGVSMRDIARQAGCHAPSIYYHFRSKDDLYQEAYAHKLDDSIEIINARVMRAEAPQTRLRLLVEALFDLLIEDHTLLLLMQRDVTDVAVTRRQFMSRRQYEHFGQLIQRLASDCLGRPVDSGFVLLVSGMIFGCMELLLADGGALPTGAQHDHQMMRKRLADAVIKLLELD